MTVSAAAALFVVMLVVASVATSLASISMMVSATAASASQMLDQMLYLLFGGIAVLIDDASEVERLSCQGMVGIHGDTVLLDLNNLGHELMVFCVCQGDDGSFEDILVVEVAIDGENFTVQFVYALRHVFSESLRRFQKEVEGVAFRQLHHLLLESVEGNAESCDKLEGAFCAGLFLKGLLSIGYSVQLVHDRHKLVGCFIHTLFIYI